jgi:hypothetical protein
VSARTFSVLLSNRLGQISYCHVYERLQMGFGLVIRFTEHLQIVTTHNYSAVANSHSATHYSTHLSLLSLLCVHWLSGNCFQQCPLLPCSRSYWLVTVPQLLTRLDSTNSVQLGWLSNIASEQIQQETLFPCWCGWRGIRCSIAAALSARCPTTWQHHFPRLSYCCMTSP